ncbi:hypothetical protein Pan189_00900 [Stratiformator vulcanicus]|uniref:Uncharacterized protein n=1 Tax=Stratiformator vulcanicus TaxID=2527980 RepID=A0A517QVY7_9PLAN|nr:hypothetical protein Pan189_00900 [Stratiformator vulcanicus]
MIDDQISVIDAAHAVGYGKQAVFKILRRLGIETFKEQSANHNGQAIAYISMDDFQTLQTDVASRQTAGADESDDDGTTPGIDYGVFYLIQLEPEHDPGRFKVGFATNINDRLRSHKCSAPFATVLKTWPCKRLWERTAIDCATFCCDQLHTEVFRTDDMATVIDRCDQFFALMPNLVDGAGLSGTSEDAEQCVAHGAAGRADS